jgi:hypothetical protein
VESPRGGYIERLVRRAADGDALKEAGTGAIPNRLTDRGAGRAIAYGSAVNEGGGVSFSGAA